MGRVQGNDGEKGALVAAHAGNPLERLFNRRRGVRSAFPRDGVPSIHGKRRLAMVVRSPPNDRAVEPKGEGISAFLDRAAGLDPRQRDIPTEVPLAKKRRRVARVFERSRERSPMTSALGKVDALGERHVVRDEPLLVRPSPRQKIARSVVQIGRFT